MERLIDANELYVDARFGENEEPYISLYQINNAPTVDAVKHGRWISSQGLAETGEVQCSNCKTIYYVDDLYNVGETDENGIGQALMPNYCPHCGAKMTLD